MGDVLLWVLVVMGLVQAGLIVLLVLRRGGGEGASGVAGADGVEIKSKIEQLSAAVRDEAERGRREQAVAGADLRTEVSRSIDVLGNRLDTAIRTGSETQQQNYQSFSTMLSGSLEVSRAQVDALRQAVEGRLGSFQELAQTHRDQLTGSLNTFRNEMTSKLEAFGEQQLTRFNKADLNDAEKGKVLREEIVGLGREQGQALQQQLKAGWEHIGQEITKLSAAQSISIADLRTTVEANLKAIRDDNEQRLEKMRQTVDEKLQSTLDQRLGESFKQVSDRLETVHKGLGEMQQLAKDVGSIQKVMSNVKSRGTWGEVLLGNLLEQILTPEQFEKDVRPTGRGEVVEYAIKLPGRGSEDQAVWLPVDSKFPKESYERLLAAQDAGDVVAAASASDELEAAVRKSAKDICEKYIEPPATTDFAIMFLPSEGLYAEVLRRSGTVEYLQRECRVVVTGPTTLAALLNSLQMGFRTLTIQKRSSEVWELLGAVKTEFGKYGDLMAKVKKQLETASKTISDTEVRTRAINRKLKDIEQLEPDVAAKVFPVQAMLEDQMSEAEAT